MKRALLVGINYRGTQSELSGCINDVENVKVYLLAHGYSEDSITVLTDDTPNKPTRSNILKGIMNLVLSGDKHLYFHYSGHGGSTRDRSGDETDGKDECLFPIDSRQSGVILDDEWRLLLDFMKKDQKLFAVLDACHSGSGMDLAYNLYQRYGGTTFSMVKDSHYTSTKGKVTMLSGCLDFQTSADAYEENQAQGALTYAFLKAMKKKVSHEDLIVKIRALLKKKGYQQIPTLSSGRKLNLKTAVKI